MSGECPDIMKHMEKPIEIREKIHELLDNPPENFMAIAWTGTVYKIYSSAIPNLALSLGYLRLLENEIIEKWNGNTVEDDGTDNSIAD